MAEVVLDSSALLALINGEPGGDIVEKALSTAVMSSVNVAEAVSKLSDAGLPESQVRNCFGRLGINVVPFDEEQAFEAGFLSPVTRNYGLSLGDRACLALAKRRNLAALTADRVWEDLSVAPVKVIP
ncbi:MAG: type II toxin-antitoxin system VapC family toxin [Armatimonadetes bacterium]|nr:type II toxin-antitoxin system VapC family toxin [Armatimonadota bacterium]